jgi:Glycosyltransferase family 87
MNSVGSDAPETGRSRAFEVYVASSAIAFFLSYVLTYAYSFYYGRMTFDSQFHPGSDFPGSLVDPAVHNPEKYNVGVHFFGDFWTTLLRSAEPSPYLVRPGVGGSSYPPLAQFIYKPLTWIPYPMALTLFLVGSTLIVAIPFWKALKAYAIPLRLTFIVVGVLLTYPFLFALDRGNNIALTTGFLLFGVLALYEDRPKRAAVFFAIAAALKVYPVFFLLIFVSRRQWRQLWTAIWVGTLLTVTPLLFFTGGPIENLRALYRNSEYFRDAGEQIALNHSLFAWFLTIRDSHFGWVSDLASALSDHYSILVLAIVGLSVMIFLGFKDLGRLQMIGLCAGLNTLLIPVTYGYTLVIYSCLALGLSLERAKSRSVALVGLLLGILLCSKSIPVGPPTSAMFNIVNVPLQAALLIVLFVPIALSGAGRSPR